MEDQVGESIGAVDLIESIANLDEDTALAIVQSRVSAGDDPLDIIQQCEHGMREVGLRYANRKYYLAGLIMGGEIFREVVEIVEPLLPEKATSQSLGTVVLGTVQGDIHDLGKSFLTILLRCHGFTVHDLGVDVSPEDFIKAMIEYRPDVIGLSAVLTTVLDSMRLTVARLRASVPDGRPTPPIVIGGSMVSEQVRAHVGADYWSEDAMSGVRLCEELVARSRTSVRRATRHFSRSARRVRRRPVAGHRTIL